LFLDFFDRTDSCKKTPLFDTYKAVQNYVAGKNHTSFQQMASIAVLQEDTLILDQMKNNKALFSFFSTRKDLSPTYSSMKAFDALKKALQ
jgi:hypothetical protein